MSVLYKPWPTTGAAIEYLRYNSIATSKEKARSHTMLLDASPMLLSDTTWIFVLHLCQESDGCTIRILVSRWRCCHDSLAQH